MRNFWHKISWIVATVAGSAIFALGFALFLMPNDMNAGGISGLAQVIVEILGAGSVGTLSILINLPLFILGGVKIGRRFFAGSLIGMVLSSVLIDLFAAIPMPAMEPLICVLYGGVICGLGLGVVFISGTSTGGSDILVRLLKLKLKNVPVGQICLFIDLAVALLTGVAFGDVTKTLYTGWQTIDGLRYYMDADGVLHTGWLEDGGKRRVPAIAKALLKLNLRHTRSGSKGCSGAIARY